MTENEIQIIKTLNKIIKSLIKGKPLTFELQTFSGDVSGPVKDLAENLTLLEQKYQESRDFILALANGKLDHLPPKDNNLIAPFKQLHSDLLHLTWQTKEIAHGNYNQKVSFMGDFSVAFNKIIKSLNEKKELENKLIESNVAKDKFFSIIAHDLKSPFSSIIGFMEILNNEYNSFSETERKQYINYVYKDVKHIFNLILDLLSWSRTQTNHISINPTNFDLDNMIEDNILLLQNSANNKEITIIKSVPEKTNLYADHKMINTIIRNLLSNAIKFTPKKGRIEIGSKGKFNKKIKIFVADSGVGIKKENIQKLFNIDEPYSTIGTNNENGTGLGLLICKEFIEKNGGEIWVKSQQGKGSQFYFTIPYNPEPEEKIKNQTKLKILIVEDVESADKHLSIVLKKISREILHAKTGIKAIELCRKNPDIDLILMDIRMPEMNGYEATIKIREFNKDVVIIAQTAYALYGNREKTFKTGCNDYISKPIRKDKLLEMIRKHLDS